MIDVESPRLRAQADGVFIEFEAHAAGIEREVGDGLGNGGNEPPGSADGPDSIGMGVDIDRGT